MSAFYWSIAYRKTKNSTLIPETDFLLAAVSMKVKTTVRTKLIAISYFDMKTAVEKTLGSDYSYSCHGDIFDVSRHSPEVK